MKKRCNAFGRTLLTWYQKLLSRKMIQKRIGRQQLLCVLAAFLLAGISYLTDPAAEKLHAGTQLERPRYGEEGKTIRLEVEGIGGKKESIDVDISPRQYTKEALSEKYKELMDQLPAIICGENKNLKEIRTNLNLQREVTGYEGIRLTWYPEDPELIFYDGAIHNQGLNSPQETSLEVSLQAGDVRENYILQLTVLPEEITAEAEQKQKLLGAIHEADRLQQENDTLQLPAEISGSQVRYTVQRSKAPLLLLLLGPILAFLLSLRPEEEKRRLYKQRQQELAADYSELTAKLLVYLGAGLTLRNAWNQITGAYTAGLQNSGRKPRAAYEEMCRTGKELEQGIPESQAYLAFAHRCGLRCYIRLASLLEQNRKNGGMALRSLLELEMQEAFEERKHAAKRLGEEAGTKLMAPLFLSLIAILIIVMVPAMLSLNA